METRQSAKEEIRRTADVVELIGQFVQLKKAGQNYVGLCPFHSEKSPSFTVSPSKQMFHCFGCKKGGDVFAFWMEYHRVGFSQALRDLADRYHIALPERELAPMEKTKLELRESLLKINGLSAEYFHDILTKSPAGRPGREYLAKRTFSKEIISEFRLGYAPDEWDGLTEFFRRERVDLERAAQAGLIIPKKSGGYYDRFRGRVIFPIANLRQQIIAFGGRVLDDSLPKYLNSPETPIFHKGECLYGLHASYKAIRESGRAVVVEGYTDVLALRGHGFHEAVATLGTALTRDHVKTLKGYIPEAIVVFDSDIAGEAASMKSLPFFLDEGLSARVVVLPEGEDPDSFVNRYGLDAFVENLNRADPMFEYYLDMKLKHSGPGIEGQVSVLKEILAILVQLKSSAQRSLYLGRLCDKMGVAEAAVLAELEVLQRSRSRQQDDSRFRERLSALKVQKRDDFHLLNLFVHYPHTVDRLMKLDYRVLLSDPVVIGIFDSVNEIYNKEGKVTAADILERVERDTAKECIREAILSPPIYPDDLIEQALEEFETKIQSIYLSESINRAKERGDIEALNRILKSKCHNQGQP